MNNIKMTEGDLVARDLRIAIVVARFNSFVVDHLLSGAIDALTRHGVAESDIEVVRVPGAYEIPLAVQRLASAKRHDALIALGAVIRGGTPHFEYVANACSTGLSTVSLQHDIPIGFGLLTVDTVEQAVERAGTKAGNKGADAALSAIEMANLLRNIAP